MRTLFERDFLHEGHIASRSSSLSFEALSSAGVEPVDWDGEDGGRQVKATGMRVFNLHDCRHQEKVGGLQSRESRAHPTGCGGLPPRQVVCTLTSASEDGGPLEVYVGVNEGNQKSGSLLRRAAACSRSI
jgi:hypothetical protein